MRYLFITILFSGIFCCGNICSAQTSTGYNATFCDKAPGLITKAELEEIAGRKLAPVQLSGGKEGCEMTDFSIAITTHDNNRSLYYEKIKGAKLSKKALQQLKQAEAGNRIVLSGFEVKCGKESEMVKQEFVYNIVE